MSTHIIIDGYNLIRQSKKLSAIDLQDIQLGRRALVDLLAAYKKIKAHQITVVFDGTRSPVLSRQRVRQKGIVIAFSHTGESADTVIKNMARREGEKALVVSSDLDIIHSAEASGAATISAEDFEDKLTLAIFADGIEIDRDAYTGWMPTTKKKGPSRRLSKRRRKMRAKIRKL
jgi:predicted RNA-binding protein with PIN domain